MVLVGLKICLNKQRSQCWNVQNLFTYSNEDSFVVSNVYCMTTTPHPCFWGLKRNIRTSTYIMPSTKSKRKRKMKWFSLNTLAIYVHARTAQRCQCVGMSVSMDGCVFFLVFSSVVQASVWPLFRFTFVISFSYYGYNGHTLSHCAYTLTAKLSNKSTLLLLSLNM